MVKNRLTDYPQTLSHHIHLPSSTSFNYKQIIQPLLTASSRNSRRVTILHLLDTKSNRDSQILGKLAPGDNTRSRAIAHCQGFGLSLESTTHQRSVLLSLRNHQQWLGRETHAHQVLQAAPTVLVVTAMMIAGIGIVATMEETIVDVAERAAQT